MGLRVPADSPGPHQVVALLNRTLRLYPSDTDGAFFAYLCSCGGSLHTSSAPTQGHPSHGCSALSSLRCGEHPCDTLRALPENTAAPATQAKSPHTRSSCGGSSLFTVQAETGTYCGKAVSSVATSGCPSSARAGSLQERRKGMARPSQDPV